ncbi:MAG: hypothetical protein AVDCRST_MAG49-2661, partial [uncultured Thermomicrobiales bacterium]
CRSARARRAVGEGAAGGRPVGIAPCLLPTRPGGPTPVSSGRRPH